MINILFVVDEFPFPPRNGVTLPVANFIDLFSRNGFQVDILLLDLSGQETLATNEKQYQVNACATLPLKRSNRYAALMLELLGFEAVFQAWQPKANIVGDKLLPRYDLVWASPIRSYGLWLKLRSIINIDADRIITAINDSYTLTLTELSNRKTIYYQRWLYRSRAFSMYKIEKALLRNADIIAVQSKKEVDFFRDMFTESDFNKVIELKNGVALNLFKKRPEAVRDLLFIGTIDAFYRPTLVWFIREVYALMPFPRPTFLIVGKGATEEDIQTFTEFSIDYLPFVENIENTYLTSKILIAPIFKGYGTINKVIEGMAAGCVVVGDRTAFNGIESFVDNRDGLVAESAIDFLSSIHAILTDSQLASEIGDNARRLMQSDFSWSSRLHAILYRLDLL